MIEKGASGLLSTRLRVDFAWEYFLISKKIYFKSTLFTSDMFFIAN